METSGVNDVRGQVLRPGERFAFLLVLIGAASIWIAKVLLGIVNEANLDHASGTWTNLAIDLAHGTFYRPIYLEGLGFGGTRYLPLYFSLHAALIRLGGDPILAGHLLTLGSGVLLLASCFLLLRKLGVDFFTASMLSVALLASHGLQYTLATIRGDILPVALNLCGLLVFLSGFRARYREPLTAVLFVMAFATKITAVHGVIALSLWLLLNGRRREGLRVLVLTATGCCLFLLGLYYGTSGRILTIFQTCSSGGAKASTIIKMPIMSVRLIQDDAACLLLLFSVIAILCYKGKELLTTLPFLLWAVTVLITMAIFGSPGTIINHLVDMVIASALLIGYTLANVLPRQRRPFSYLVMSFVAFFAVYFSFNLDRYYDHYREHKNKYPQELIEWVKNQDGQILSEDPLIPIMAETSPFISDSFMLRIILQNDRSLKDMLLTQIKKRAFSAIILINNPRASKDWYAYLHLGSDFIQAAMENYEETFWTGRFHIYEPIGKNELSGGSSVSLRKPRRLSSSARASGGSDDP